ncbi:hypothetical protein KXD40_001678 [Peronospora effusa]|uniref:Myotubularin phosphatase domain-containing protein n=1 Tax=Peronospora effusa TaxID=542832 RepID=A0A3M6VRK0_9STRA|nr:hypothetical protein DD238_001526 [Peronospora effusa]RQM17132.1 hypothetical protein DD237_001934 [Peronospora effusa]UIZ27097.1 hypothetical protein KXD40_001678 [Peronospora effusa]
MSEDEDAVRSRLIGESDVLAAVMSEYLDENASKKDTSAATVCLGRVFMTTFRFQFVPDEHEYDRARRHLLNRSEDEIKSFFLIPLGCIASVKKKNSIVEISTKDLRQLSFRFDVVEITKIFSVLTTYVFPDKTEFLFAFYHRLSENMLEEEPLLPCSLDWDVYNDQAEWERQGVFENGKWKVTSCNANFCAIDTYPERLVVPVDVTDEFWVEFLCLHYIDAMNFRSLGRIPCLTWLNEVNGATLCRSSQPKVGMSKATSSADESLVAGIASSSPLQDQLQIIDCRPMSSAMANRAKGYGVESSVNYKNCTVSFMEVPNIHSMRERDLLTQLLMPIVSCNTTSMRKLRNLCASPSCDNLRWLGSVEDTKWLVYIRQLLKAGLHVAALLRSGESVLLHCSHGWDRTSQIASLAQIIVDPYFRTWKGFQVLIEKEWLSFGHPFHLRHSHGEKADTQESPIFIQFLDCISQLVRIYPTYFEFNEGLLLLLADALYSCRFGTFFFDCKKHREDADLKNRTPSVWTWANGFKPQLTEQTYVPKLVLNPPLAGLLKRVALWDAMFMRWPGQPLVQEPPISANFFADNTQRTPTWQLPQSTINALNVALTLQYREARLIQELKERIATLEERVNGRRGSRH